MHDTTVVLEEGNHPLQICPKCEIFVTWKALNRTHQATKMCARGSDRRLKQLREEEARMSTTTAFDTYGSPLETVMTFKYLWMSLMASDDDWMSVVANLRKVRRQWARLSRILRREGGDPRRSGNFYKAVIQLSLLFDAETWVMSPSIGMTLGGFHHKVARRLAGMRPMLDTMARWVYPPLDVVMMTVGLEEVVAYVLLRQNTAAQYIATRLILELCLAEDRRPGARVTQRWWDQARLDFGQEAGRAAELTGELGAEGEREDDAEISAVGRRVEAE